MTSLTLDDIDHASQHRAIFPGFDAPLEALYRTENIEDHHTSLKITWIIGICLYDSIIISDYFISGNYFTEYLIGRFCVCTPICLLMIYKMRLKNLSYEMFVGFVPLTMTATLSILIILSQGSYRSDYLFGDLLLMICGCVISRPRIRYAIPTVLAQYCMYQTVVIRSDVVGHDSFIVASMFGLCGVVVALMTAYALEQIERRAFLLSLRVRLLNRELTSMALTDPLTRLGNRRRFEEATTELWASSSENPKQVSFILIDLDRFKSFNDNYGHSAGDFCLSTVARAIAGQMRHERDLAVRFGGEEFLIVLPDTDFINAHEVAERIRLAILEAAIPHPVITPDAVVSASLGLATSLTNEIEPADLVIRADMALYAAKQQGRNRVWPPRGPDLLSTAPEAAEPLPKVA